MNHRTRHLPDRFHRLLLLSIASAAFFAFCGSADAAPNGNAPGTVIYNGHAVNPARVLVRWKEQGDDAPRALRAAQALRSADAVALGVRSTGLTAEAFSQLDGVGVIEFSDTALVQAALSDVGATAETSAAVLAGAGALQQLKNRMAALAASGEFAYVEPDYIQRAFATPADAAFADGRLWGLRNTGQSGGTSGVDTQAVSAWDLTTGSTNVIVAVIDTGIRFSHRDLTGNMWRNPGETAGNGIDDDGNGIVDDVFGLNAITRTGNPMDDNGHGSHCAGTIGGTANDVGDLVGVAWNVRLMGLKFLAADGGGNTSDAIRCIDYAIARGAHIISGSYGGGGFSQATSDAVERARQAGILCVFAAGNESNNNDANPAYPASYSHNNIVSVAAVSRTGALASFSNYGATSVDIAAPGVDIFSCDDTGDSAYQTISGTSMATPHVAGVAALLKARFPGETYLQLRERLLSSTKPLTALQGRVATGGLVQARAAMDLSADGILEVSVSVSPSPLLAGESATIAVRVSDRSPLTGATVTGSLGGVPLLFQDDGVAPDERAADATYSVRTSVPVVPTGTISLTLAATASGKTPYNGTSSLPVVARAANDAFAAADTLDLAALPVRATNLDCSRETGEPSHAGNIGGRSVWWAWTAPSAGQMQLTTAGSSFDTLLAVYTGTAVSALTSVASNDDTGNTTQSAVTFAAVSGTTYRIAVDGFGAASGNIVLNATFAGSGAGNTAPSFVRQPASVRVQQGETIRLSAEVAGTPTPTLRWSLNGSELADGGRISGSGSAELVITAAAAADGGDYRLTATNSVGTAQSLAATVVVDVALVRPANDNFAQRLALVGAAAQATGSNTGATAEVGEPGHAGVTAQRTVWWTWTAPATDSVTIDTFGSSFDTVLAVYRGSAVALLTGVASNDDAPGSRQSRVAFTAEAGVQYAIAVGSYTTADSGAIGLRLVQGGASGIVPEITRQPLDMPMLEGFDGALTVVASGSQPFTYQWWRNGAPLAGATGAVLRFSGGQLSDAGQYYVVVSNAYGSVTSEPVTVTVNGIASPPNDHFANAARIGSGGELILARLNGATREPGEPLHADGTGGTMWWVWTALSTGQATISTHGSIAESGNPLDTVLAVYIGTALNALTPVASNDDADDGVYSEVQFNAVAGTTYRIAIGGYAADDVGILIMTTSPASLSVPQSAPMILLQPATYVAAVGEEVAFLVGVSGSPNPAVQWQRSTNHGASWTNLSDGGTVSGSRWLVLEMTGVDASQNGYLVRAVVSNAAGSVTSNTAQLVVLPQPANDHFADALLFPAGTGVVAGDNSGATVETGEPSHASVGSASIWWTWTAPFSGTAVFETTGSDFDTVLAVYTGGSVGALTAIAGNDDTGDSRQSRVEFTAVVGTTYRIAVGGYGGAYGRVALSAPTDLPPSFTRQPLAAVSVSDGGTVTISAGATGSPAPGLQWQRSTNGGATWVNLANDTTFSGVETSTLVIRDSTAALGGHRFRVVAGNTVGSVTSTVAVLSVTNPLVQLVNLSTRAASLGGNAVIIPGFFISGSGTKRVLIRAVGPKLFDYGVAGFLPDPILSVYRTGQAGVFAENDNWGTQQPGRPDPAAVGAQVAAFPLTPTDGAPSNDALSAAMVLDLPAGGYSTIARDTLDRSGIGIVEVYDVDDANTGGPRLVNVSNRGFVGSGLQVMIPGFYVEGGGARRYLVRAVGPKLADFGLAADTLLANPRLSVKTGQTEVASNDDWAVQTVVGGSSADVLTLSQQVGAFSLSASDGLPTDDQRSAALVVWLQPEPAGYTVVVSGADGGTGIAIAEVYEIR